MRREIRGGFRAVASDDVPVITGEGEGEGVGREKPGRLPVHALVKSRRRQGSRSSPARGSGGQQDTAVMALERCRVQVGGGEGQGAERWAGWREQQGGSSLPSAWDPRSLLARESGSRPDSPLRGCPRGASARLPLSCAFIIASMWQSRELRLPST